MTTTLSTGTEPQRLIPKLDELGHCSAEFAPTFDYPGEYINGFHRALAALPLNGLCIQYRAGERVPPSWFRRTVSGLLQRAGYRSDDGMIPGWLQQGDALKLYEMAYFARGDILELGCYHGLSTSIMARAALDANAGARIDTVDLSPRCVRRTLKTLARQGLKTAVRATCDDAVRHVQRHADAGKRFAFVFIDHSHAYLPVFNVCKLLSEVVSPGAYCCFHDFNDYRNADLTSTDYRVYQAVVDGLDPTRFQFSGLFGCTALFRRRPAVPPLTRTAR
jgi:predicted O-methyltransferase YrrM